LINNGADTNIIDNVSILLHKYYYNMYHQYLYISEYLEWKNRT